MYCRYVDDTFVVINNYHELERLQSEFEENSVLKYTFEIENQKKIPFLDTLITRSSNSVSAEVYIKPTNTGECLNYNSICPMRYKTGLIKTLLHRSFSICSTMEIFKQETTRLKQLLINNNFPNYLVDRHIKQFIDNKNKFSNAPSSYTSRSNISITESTNIAPPPPITELSNVTSTITQSANATLYVYH